MTDLTAREQCVVPERERVGVVVDRVLDKLVFAAVLYAVPLFQSAQRVWSEPDRHFCPVLHNFLHFPDLMPPTAPQTPCFLGIARSRAVFSPQNEVSRDHLETARTAGRSG